MNLEETLRKMKENEKTFYPLVEGMKRRADKGLLEGITSDDIDYYVNKIEKDTAVVEDHININQEIFELNEAIEKFGYMSEVENQILDEAVTFIDNAGNLKTMSTPDYVKDQHEYHTETQIAKYEKKKKKRDYKLISEEIDIDNIKKLSEMSLEDILNEEWDS